MPRKKKAQAVEEPKVEQPQQVTKHYEYADLAVICKCGRVQVVQPGMKDGFQLTMVPSDTSYIHLKCDVCDAELRLGFIEVAAPVEKEKTDESIQEENKQEESL